MRKQRPYSATAIFFSAVTITILAVITSFRSVLSPPPDKCGTKVEANTSLLLPMVREMGKAYASEECDASLKESDAPTSPVQNCSSSVEPFRAWVERDPQATTCATWSK